MLDLALATLTSPPVLFFALGLTAALVRSDLALPEAVSKGLSLYLVLAIGFKGGVEMGAGASWWGRRVLCWRALSCQPVCR
ncbi:sodium-dependent bicarbonate transport family permease [Maricaulis sp.]|uniref:sodium-dependent bicarbonate transport family permease n=1 Tax=Maricaulis sp. TaxID=1486257 RepID=UPI0025B959CD|nr:sodium-dependent bicarbonate transport family permease [Maricaulis sp.]